MWEIQAETSMSKKDFQEKSIPIKENVSTVEKERIKKLRDKIKDRSYFYKPEHFVPIYEVKKKQKKPLKRKVQKRKIKTNVSCRRLTTTSLLLRKKNGIYLIKRK